MRVSIPFIAGQWSLLLERYIPKFHRHVSIPFIAGQWSLRPSAAHLRHPASRVSIPFIAGQWSLRLRNVLENDPALAFQSPSLRGSGLFVGLRAMGR